MFYTYKSYWSALTCNNQRSLYWTIQKLWKMKNPPPSERLFLSYGDYLQGLYFCRFCHPCWEVEIFTPHWNLNFSLLSYISRDNSYTICFKHFLNLYSVPLNNFLNTIGTITLILRYTSLITMVNIDVS